MGLFLNCFVQWDSLVMSKEKYAIFSFVTGNYETFMLQDHSTLMLFLPWVHSLFLCHPSVSNSHLILSSTSAMFCVVSIGTYRCSSFIFHHQNEMNLTPFLAGFRHKQAWLIHSMMMCLLWDACMIEKYLLSNHLTLVKNSAACHTN